MVSARMRYLFVRLFSKFNEIIFLGMVGSRMDMNLMNVFALEKIPEKINARIIHLNQEIFLIRKSKTLRGREGERVSFISLKKDANISLTGFRYDVQNFKLKFGTGVGVSNEFKKEKAVISFKDGLILCIYFREGAFL